jgi:hypothetical protein
VMQQLSLGKKDDAKKFEFWSTQPVPKLGKWESLLIGFGELMCRLSKCSDDVVTENGPIEPDVPTEMIRQEPYSLPDGFTWDTLDLSDPPVVSYGYRRFWTSSVHSSCIARIDNHPYLPTAQ